MSRSTLETLGRAISDIAYRSAASMYQYGGLYDAEEEERRALRGEGRRRPDPVDPPVGCDRVDLGDGWDAAALLDQLGGSGAVVAGTSVGATIGIDLARLRPDLVRAVVAHESPWHVTRYLPTLSQVAALSKMGWLSLRRRYPEAAETFLRFAYTDRYGGSAWDRFPDEWRRTARDNAQAALVDVRMALGAYPTAKQLASVRSPVLCTCGARSAPTMVRVTQKLARVIPTASFHQIDGAGHAAPFDAPAGFSQLIARAIAGA